MVADLVICGGGMAGTCAAITAARAGARVVLVNDRPVLGGNASSEVRLWALGATAHMGNNNRWAREGGVMDEIAVENTYRNPDGNTVLTDTVILEKVIEEPNITLLLNTAVFEVVKSPEDSDRIAALRAFCSQNSTRYELHAPQFMDASGDGLVAFLAGGSFRMGAERAEEFGEGFAPSEAYGELLGHSIYFMSKDVGHPVAFVPPSYAYRDMERIIPRYRDIAVAHQACQFWWIEYGGRLDTVHDTEQIKWELWRIVYGVWDYIKNSGRFPDVENLTLEWVGTVPGKRESRRFEGDYMLHQQDLVQQRQHPDAVSFGGWALDLHPADGVFTEKPGCNQWHAKGVYQVPYRCLYSRNIQNLFLAGRIISCSHVAFGSMRVMMSCAHHGQAAAIAAVLCLAHDCDPRAIGQQPERIEQLQKHLIRRGQYIPGHALDDQDDLARQATCTASSEFRLTHLPPDGPGLRLENSWAMMLPVKAGRVPRCSFYLQTDQPTELDVELRASSREGNHTPDVVLAKQTVPVPPMPMRTSATDSTVLPDAEITLDFEVDVDRPQYVFVCLKKNPHVTIRCSEQRLTGVLAVHHKMNKRVATGNTQTPPAEIGIDSFELWRPRRRPDGHNLAMTLEPGLEAFKAEQLFNGIDRPVAQPNAWVADPADAQPTLTLQWDEPRTIHTLVLMFDTDFDHPMETSLWQHPERITPFCVQSYRVRDDQGHTLASCTDNHQTCNRIRLPEPVRTRSLTVELDHPPSGAPAALLAIRCYEQDVESIPVMPLSSKET